jgi:hypothetical protein
MYIFSQDGERDSHNKLKKSNSIAVTESRHGTSPTPPSHDGKPLNSTTGKSSFIQRRRLRQPVWARSTTTQKKLLPIFLHFFLSLFLFDLIV